MASNNSTLNHIFSLLEEGDDRIKLGKYKDIVLVLGIVGSGKTTFTQFIAGDNEKLQSKEIGKDTGKYTIVDDDGKINTNTIMTPKTIFPNLMVHEKTRTSFYDCPGFSDIRNTETDVASAYLVRTVIEHAESVKLLFVVDYHTVKEGTGIHDFLDLLRHAVTFIRNIEKFQDSIGLVVTKVDNRYVSENGVSTFVTDFQETNNIGRFIENVKTSMKNISKDASDQERQFYKNVIKLLDIFLIKENENYTRIGLFRRPNKAGSLSDIPILQNEKYRIVQMIENDLRFAVNDVTNFRYPISVKSKNDLMNISATVDERMIDNVAGIMRQIEHYCTNYTEETDDIDEKRDILAKVHDVLSGTIVIMQDSLTPMKFLKTILQSTKTLNIPVSTKILEEVVTLDKHINFLQSISNDDVKGKSNDWLKPLEDTVKSLEDSINWYNFLMDLYSRLSKFDIHEDKSRYGITALQEHLKDLQKDNIPITGDTLKYFLYLVYEENLKEKRSIPGYDNVKDLVIDESRLKNLNRVLDAVFGSVDASCSKSKKELIVQGAYVKMSDVTSYLSISKNNTCPVNLESLKILAWRKIFIDTDLVQIDSKLLVTIIAPIWEIIGDRRIVLDGGPGKVHSMKKAKSGIFRDTTSLYGGNGMSGDDGLAGITGGSAGSFFGIGDTFIHEDNLQVTVNGGDGSDGQDGGDGANGSNGQDANWNANYNGVSTTRWTDRVTLFYTIEYEHRTGLGFPGGHGGNGGNGGVGGYGGNEGEVMIYGLSNIPKIQIKKIKGRHGAMGNGGKSGIGGKKGDDCYVEVQYHYVMGSFTETREYGRKCGVRNWTRAISGIDGVGNYVHAGRVQAEDARKIKDPSYIVNDYKNYYRRYTSDNFDREATNFYEKLNNDRTIKMLYDSLGLIDEFQSMEDQYYSLNGRIDFLPFYRSFIERVVEYASSPKSNENTKVYKNVLAYLYTAAMSKICSLKGNDHEDMVIRISEYLNLVTRNIDEFQRLSNEVIIKEHNAQYKRVLDRKITEANHLIDDHINEEIKQIERQIDEEMNTLIDEIGKLEKETRTKLKRQILIKKKKELIEKHMLKIVIGILKIVGFAIKFINPMVSLTLTIVAGALMIADIFKPIDSDDNVNLKPTSKSFEDVTSKAHECLTRFNEENAKLEQLEMTEEEMYELHDKLNLIRRYKNQIVNETLPMMTTVRDDLNDLQDKLKDRSQVSLLITKWQVQRTLRGIKVHMNDVISQIKPRNNIINLYETLNEGIDTLINVYDKIQSYVDDKTFADYIANIHLADSTNIDAGNSELQGALNRLRLSIKSNIILEQYEKATSALTQFVFPFAEFYIDDFRLPSSIKIDKDLQDITSNAIRKIRSFQTKLLESEVSIQKHDKYVHHGYFYNDNEYTKPFYVWYNDQHENNIKGLFSGREILLKADVTKSGKRNAIKFNEIGLFFKVHDAVLQNELNERLKHFDVSMTHLGNSYYKCDSRYYVIPSNPQTIRYSFAKFNQTTHISKNVVYQKLKNAPCMLSPYAMWKIQLSITGNANFTVLEKFGNLTDLELVGTGQYLLPDVDICYSNLNVYYTESDISDTDNLYNRLRREATSVANVTDDTNSTDYDSNATFDLNHFPYDSLNFEWNAENYMRSGASSNHECVVNQIVRWFKENLQTLKSFNPIDYLSQWFGRGNDENLYFNSNQISDIFNDPTDSNIFGSSSTFDVNSNLMLANFVIRKYVTGMKYDAGFPVQNLRHSYYDVDDEYAHSIAYSYYCPNKQNQNVQSNLDTSSEYDEEVLLNNVSPIDNYANVDAQGYSVLAGHCQESTRLLT